MGKNKHLMQYRYYCHLLYKYFGSDAEKMRSKCDMCGKRDALYVVDDYTFVCHECIRKVGITEHEITLLSEYMINSEKMEGNK